MKRVSRRLLALLLMLAVMASAMPVAVFAEENTAELLDSTVQHCAQDGDCVAAMNGTGIECTEEELTAILQESDNKACRPRTKGQRSDCYGRTALSGITNGNALVYVYDCIQDSFDAQELVISFASSTYRISADELYLVIDTVLRDHPEYFWLQNGYNYWTSGGIAVKVAFSATMSANQITAANAAIQETAEEILSDITVNMSQYEKELYIHDRLAAHITYVNGTNAHNIYGALAEGKAVCDGYAKAFQYLLRQEGIWSYMAAGVAGGGAHAWNYVQIDNKYYQVDLTWNDQGEELYHMYFNQTDAIMAEDHTETTDAYALPVCNSTDAFYFNGRPEYLDIYTVDSVRQLFLDNRNHPHVYIPGNVNTFITWIRNNIGSFVCDLDVSGSVSFGYSQVGRELILKVESNNVAKVEYADGTTAHYATVEEALSGYTADAVRLQLLTDTAVNATLRADLYLDLNGYDLTGTLSTNGYCVYGIDSMTNQYSCTGMGYFDCTDSQGSKVVPQKLSRYNAYRYMTVETENGYTFHRFYLGITHIRLAPLTMGLGYRAAFYGDYLVRRQVDQQEAFGYRFSLPGIDPVTKYTGADQLYSGKTVSLRVDGIAPEKFGQTELSCNAVLKLSDGTLIHSAETTGTLQTVMETVNDSYTKLSEEQLALIREMILNHPVIKNWKTNNLYS